MAKQSRQDRQWEEFEGWVKERLEKARRRALLADSFDEMEEIVGGAGQEFQQALLRAVAEQREPAGQHCPVCGEVMQRKGRLRAG